MAIFNSYVSSPTRGYDVLFLSCKLKLLLGQANNAGIAWEPQPRVACHWLYAPVYQEDNPSSTCSGHSKIFKKNLITEWHQQKNCTMRISSWATSAYPLCTAASQLLSKQHRYAAAFWSVLNIAATNGQNPQLQAQFLHVFTSIELLVQVTYIYVIQ